MQLFKYIENLVPHLKRNEVVEDVAITRQELETVVQPLVKDVLQSFKSDKLVSKEAKEVSASFFKAFKVPQGVRKTSNLIETIGFCLDNVAANLDTVEEQANNLLEPDVLKSGITVKKAVVLRSAELLCFVSRFTVDLVDYILCKETAATKGGDTELTAVNKATERNIIENISDFARTLSVYAMENKKFSEDFSSIPDLTANLKNEQSIRGIYSEQQLDPFNNYSMKNFFGNPIYHLRLQISEWQNSRYQNLRDKKRMLELRILHLELERENGTNPKLETELTYIKNRVEDIESKMRDLES